MENTIKKSSLINYIIFVAIIFRCIPNLIVISYILLIILCFLGPRPLIISFFLCWLFSSLNLEIFPNGDTYKNTRFIIIFIGLFQSFHLLSKIDIKKNVNIYFYLTLFVLFVLIHSLFVSSIISISILKILLWFSSFVLLINSWIKISQKEFNRLIKNIFWIFIAIVFFSLLIINSKFAYIKNIDHFQGIINHPQHFAIMLVIFMTMIFTGFPYKLYSRKIRLLILLPLIYMLFLTNSRTGILTFVLIYLIYLMIDPTFDNIRKKYTNTTKLIFLFSILVMPLLILSFFQINTYLQVELIQNFITKSSDIQYQSLFENYGVSRGIILSESIINIKNNLWSGIGFGIGSDLNDFYLKIKSEPIFGIPYSAPIEKGNLFIAVFEELGAFGFILFILFLFICYLNIYKGSFRGLPMFCAIILLNLGEFTFFSPGSAGGLCLIFFTLVVVRKEFKF